MAQSVYVVTRVVFDGDYYEIREREDVVQSWIDDALVDRDDVQEHELMASWKEDA